MIGSAGSIFEAKMPVIKTIRKSIMKSTIIVILVV